MAIKTPSSRLFNPDLLPPKGQAHSLDIETLFFIRMIFGLAWSADSSQLYFETNITGRLNLFRVDARGGWPMQMNVCEERTALVSLSRDGRFLLYTQDQDGNEKPNLFLMSPKGGQAFPLTRTQGISYRSMMFSPDNQQLLFAAELEGRGEYGLYVLDLPERLEQLAEQSPTPRLIASGKQHMWNNCLWAPDGKSIAAVHTIDSAHNAVCVVSLDGQVRELLPDDGHHETDLMGFSPDGRFLLINSNLSPSGQLAPGLLHVDSAQIEWLEDSPWEVTAVTWSRDGKSIVLKYNEAGNERLDLLDFETRTRTAVPLPAGVFGSVKFSPDNTRMAFHYGAANRPTDIWVMERESLEVKQITNSLVGGLEPDDLIRPHLVTYPSDDGTPIAAFLYLPREVRTDGSNPGIVMVRGGPTAQTQNRYSRDIQYLVSRGYVVIAPNYRGSTGFGQVFQESNRRDLGGGDLQDIVAARRFLIDAGFADSQRVAVMGGSYGGYLTLMAVTKAPDLWAAGVAIVPFANWFTEYENEDEVLKAFDRMMMGDPVENRAFWIDRSPYFFVDQIKAPLLMLAGGNDIRCPASETREIAAKILERGGTVEYKIYENEGHSFAKRENSIDAFKRTVSFLERHV
ncbi:MAG: alpha/beta fold hydrolase [Myxococcota bacterium]